MTEQQHNCLSDGEEDPDESQIDHPIICNNDADIRKSLFDEFDVPAKQKTSSDSSGREYMKVYLRVRPFSDEEIEGNENQQCVEKESRTAVLLNAPKESFAFKNSTRAGGEVSHRFSFTNVFDEETTQKSFFDETTLPLVTDFIHGQNCLVFTYGVTNSGKTYTIQGTPKDGGLLPRTLDVLFNSIEGKHYHRMNLKPRFCTDVTRLTDEEEHRENNYKTTLLLSLDKETFDLNALLKLDQDSTVELSKASCIDESALQNTVRSQDGGEHEEPSIDVDENTSRVIDDTTINVDAQGPVKFSVWVSFAEIYNETIYDLLEPCPPGKGKKRTTLRLGDDSNGNPYIKGLREIYVSNADEAYKILKIGQKNQRIASTKLNQCSSRSHCIFSVKVLRVVDVEDPHVARVSRLSFVDLAGSERYSKTQSKGDRLKEAGNINTSLMTLGKCLEYLRYNQRNPSQPLIIPFRESKLTRLFQGFFCGKGRAAMIVNVNMCASMFDETFHVMKFSAIAKKVTTRVTKPVDLPPPLKKARASAPATPRSKPGRPSVPWANGALTTPAPPDDAPILEVDEEDEENQATTAELGAYQQQLMDLVKVLQEKLIEEKRKMQTLEVKIREEVCQEMAEQLVSIEKAYSERVKMEVTAVEEKCDRRIELLTQSIKKTRKRARIERIEEDDEEWVPSVFLHAEQTKVREKQQLISELNAKIAELRQEVKQLKESRKEETATSEAVLELQTHLNDANEEVAELKQMLEEAGEAFTEKEAEISKLRAALDDQEACIKKQDAALKHLTAELEKVKATKVETDVDELSRTKGALEATMAKLADSEKQLETRDSMMKELVRTLEETREELARERSYVAQAFDNDEEMIRIKEELQKAETQTKELEQHLVDKDKAISSLEKVIEDAKATSQEENTQAEDKEKTIAEKIFEIAALAEQLNEAKEELHCTKAELVKIKVDSSGKDSQLEKLRKEFNGKALELEDASRKISDAVAELEDMKKQGLEKEAELNLFREVNSETATELESLKKALAQKDEALARAKCEANSTRGTEEFDERKAEEMTKQANRIKDVEAEIQKKALELENAKSESAIKISELETELTECKKEIEKLQNGNALTEIEQQLEESTKALDKKNTQVIAKNNTIKRLEMALAEKERLLSDMEKLPKEPNLRAKEELKTLRRRLVQADKEREESRELLTKKEEKLEEAKQALEKLRDERDEKSAKFLRELQGTRTELAEAKEDAKKKEEQIQSLKEKLDSQSLKNACLQTQLENEKRGLLEKERALQKAKEELNSAKSSSATELDEARTRLASTEEKVQELEDEVFTANETTSRIQDEMRKYQNEVVPALENRVKALEEERLRSGERVKEAEEELEQESREAHSRLEKRNEEIEQKVKEVNELREAIKTLDQEKFQELDKVWQEMISMQKTIEERNKTIDEQEQKLREASLKQGKSEELNQTVTDQLKTKQEKSKEQIGILTDQLKSLREEKSSLEGRLRLVTSDAGKDKEVIAKLQKVLEEQDHTLTEQGQALDERQNEIETLTTELQGWQEKCALTTRELEKKKEEISGVKKQALVESEENKRLESRMKDMSSKQESTEQNSNMRLKQMEEEIRKLKQDCSCFEAQLEKKDEEIRKAHDSRENIMKTMRETLEVAKANKAEYEIKLATVREQCRQELKREMDEELRRTKRDFQRQLNDKDKSLEEIKNEKESVEKVLAAERAETSKTDSSASEPEAKGSMDANSSISQSNKKKPLKRSSSEMTLAEVKKQLSASKSRKTGESEEEFTPGSVRKTRSRASTKKAGRSSSCRSKRTTPATKVDILSPMEETESDKAGDVTEKKKLFRDLQENANGAGGSQDEEPAQLGEGRENIPPASQFTTKKRRKLFQKPSSVASLLSPATLKGSRHAKTEQDSTRNIIARQLRPRANKYN